MKTIIRLRKRWYSESLADLRSRIVKRMKDNPPNKPMRLSHCALERIQSARRYLLAIEPENYYGGLV